MRPRSSILLLLGVALLWALPASVSLAGEKSPAKGRPKTVRDLLLELGAPAKANQQMKLKIVGKTVGKDLGELPAATDIDLRYDKVKNRIRVVMDSEFSDGTKRKVTTYSEGKRAARWGVGESGADLRAVSLEPGQTLPNPWSLPVKLAFPGLFADALQGYQALAREFARSVPLNREPDDAGLLWFDLRPSVSSGVAMRNEFNAGLKVKAGIDAKSGLLMELQVTYKQPEAVTTMRVVDQSMKLTEEDQESFGIPDKVMEFIKNPPKPKPAPVEDPGDENTKPRSKPGLPGKRGISPLPRKPLKSNGTD